MKFKITTLAISLVLLLAWPVMAQAAINFGADWSEVGTNALVSATEEQSVAVFLDEIYAIGGTVSGSVSPKVFNSSDGASWAEVGTDVLPAARRSACALVFDDQLWLIGGLQSGGTASRTVYATADGSTWAEVGSNALPHASGVALHSCAVKDGLMWVFGGYDGSNIETVYNSSDGATWTEAGTDALPLATRQHRVLVKGNSFYLIGGAAEPQAVYQSTDGENWNPIGTSVLPTSLVDFGGVFANGQLWVVGGRPSGGSPVQTVYSSSDGEEWVEVGQNALPGARHSFGNPVLFNGRLYVLGGNGGVSGTETVYRTDAIAGIESLPQPEDVVGELASAIGAIDQSGDTATSSLPILSIAAQEETANGFPLVQLTLVLGLLVLTIIAAFTFARIMPENPLPAVVVMIFLTTVGFLIGREAIPWYVFLSVFSLGSAVVSIRRMM